MTAAIASPSAVCSNYKQHEHLNKMSTIGTKIMNVVKIITLGDTKRPCGLTRFSGGLKGQD